MDIDSLSRYRKDVDSQLKYCFRYFESKTDEELFDILTQKNATIRPFIYGLMQNQIPTWDQSIGEYACDLLHFYKRYTPIRSYLEYGFGFQKLRWTTSKQYVKRYRLWIKYWQFEHRHNQIETTPQIRPAFNLRFTLSST